MASAEDVQVVDLTQEGPVRPGGGSLLVRPGALNNLKSKSRRKFTPLEIQFYLLGGVFRPVYNLYTPVYTMYTVLVSGIY